METSRILVCRNCLLNSAGVKAGVRSIRTVSAIFLIVLLSLLFTGCETMHSANMDSPQTEVDQMFWINKSKMQNP
jgi:hypothetical protein